MANITFSPKSESGEIELYQLLKVTKVVATGGMSGAYVQNGEVKLNGEVELKVRKKLAKGDVVEFYGTTIEVV